MMLKTPIIVRNPKIRIIATKENHLIKMAKKKME